MRKLEDHFLEDLKTGLLNALLNYVKADNTLDLEIRENYINIYYRGGNLLRVKWIRSTYNYFFDEKYLTQSPLALKQSVTSSKK